MMPAVFRANGSRRSVVESLLSINRAQVGVSTGYMEAERGRWPDLVGAAFAVSEGIAELSALSASELPALLAFLDDDEPPFRRLTVHGPAKGWDRSAYALADELATLPASVSGVVMHPETLGNCEAFTILGGRLLLENMDTRKQDARTVEELLPYFEALPAARFCFDIAHAWLHDESLTLAHELLNVFGDRLAEVHLSSILHDGRHVSLTAEDAVRFRPVLERCVHVPWILEAPLTGR